LRHFAWTIAGTVTRPCWLGPITRIPRPSWSVAHSPGFARRADVLASVAASRRDSSVTARGRSEAIGGGGNCGRTSRHRPGCLLVSGACASAHYTSPTGAAKLPLLRFCPLQHSLVAARHVSGGCRPSRTIPASAFSLAGPARSSLTDSGGDCPCGFTLRRAPAGNRSGGGRSWCRRYDRRLSAARRAVREIVDERV
jgi:hypothetical protein